jgi:hypothetical protein
VLAQPIAIVTRQHAADLAIAFALLLFALITGERYVTLVQGNGVAPEFYQAEFGPAVLVACGHPYANPNLTHLPALESFLTRRADRFDCGELPAAVVTSPLSGPQATWKYLLLSAAATWRAQGEVTWVGLRWMSAILLGLTALSSYVLLRLLGGRTLAVIGALAVVTSPLHLRYLLHIRDYSKAPFMILIGAGLAVLLMRRLTTRSLAAWSAGLGLLTGVAMGFRNDIIIVIPAFVVAAVYAAAQSDRQRVLRAAAAVGAAAIGLVVAAYPLLGAYGRGGGASMSHVALLGLAPTFDIALGVERSPLYGFGHGYNDSSVALMVADVAYRHQSHHAPIDAYDAAYDKAADAIADGVVETMPADIWVRGLASIAKVFELPASTHEDIEPAPFVTGALGAFHQWRASIVRGRETAILAITVLAILVAAARAPLAGVVMMALVCYFAAYPALQFHERHYFHLNIIPIAAVVYLIASAVDGVRALVRGTASRIDRATVVGTLRGAAVAIAALLALTVAPLLLLRQWQESRVARLIEQYAGAPRQAVTWTTRDTGDGLVAVDITGMPAAQRSDASPRTVQSEYLAFGFDATGCPSDWPLHLRYNPAGSPVFARALQIHATSKVQVLVPVYFFRSEPGIDGQTPHTVFRFEGVAVPSASSGCLKTVERVTDIASSALMIDLVVPEQWRSVRRHEILPGLEPAW